MVAQLQVGSTYIVLYMKLLYFSVMRQIVTICTKSLFSIDTLELIPTLTGSHLLNIAPCIGFAIGMVLINGKSHQ